VISVAPGGVLPDCQTDPTQILSICIRLTPLIGGQPNPDTRVFAVGDTLRVTMEIRNLGEVPLFNVQPGPVTLRASTEAEDPDAVSRAIGDPSQSGQAASAAAAQAAASAASRGQSPAQAAVAAQTAAQGVQQAAAGNLAGVGATACVLAQTSNINRSQLLRGPNPVSIDRLPPTPPNGQPAVLTWDFLVDQQATGDLVARAGRQRFATQQGDLGSAGATALNRADGTLLLAGLVASDPLEKAIQCVFPSLAAEPSVIEDGGEFTLMMRVLNSNGFYLPRRWTDLIPSALREYRENISTDFQLTLLSGPSNPVTSAPVNLGESEVTYFTWRYRITGTGCVHLRGRMLGRGQLGGDILLSNTVDSGLICSLPSGRTRLQTLSGEHGPAGLAARGGGPATVVDQAALCRVPRDPNERPQPSAELRLVRDASGNYWQVQSGCRHAVTPFVMDATALQRIPEGEEVSYITYGLDAPVSSLAPMEYPPYTDIPLALRPDPLLPPPPPSDQVPPPSVLLGYANRVLVLDPADPSIIYLLDGGSRHRVVVFYPLDVPTDAIFGLRGGDELSYRLRRSVTDPQISCPAVQNRPRDQLATFVGCIDEVPLGAPAPYYGWGTGETLVISDHPRPASARKCTLQPGPATCSARFRLAPLIDQGQYTKDPTSFRGQDVRFVGLLTNVRYNPSREGTTARFVFFPPPLFALGQGARRDPDFITGTSICAGVAIGSGETPESELTIFEYVVTNRSACE
jgi:hypothetical protein